MCGNKEVVKCDRDPPSCLVPLSRTQTFELKSIEDLPKLMNERNSDFGEILVLK